MIAKLTTGNGFGGTARYDFRIGTKEQGKTKVLAFDGVDERLEPREIAKDFRFQAMMYPTVRKPVYHWALSWKVGEDISDEQMTECAMEFLMGIGFTNTQYVIVRHEKENQHCHIITNIVDYDGNRISTKGLINKSHKVARKITLSHGFAWGESAKKETIEAAHKPHEKARYTLEPMIKAAVAKAKHIDELPELLHPSGVECIIKWSDAGKPVGISFSFEMEGQQHTFKGSAIDRSLSAGNIAKEIQARAAELEAQRIAEEKERVRKQREAQMREQARNREEQLRVEAEAKAKAKAKEIKEGFTNFSGDYYAHLKSLKDHAFELYEAAKQSGIKLHEETHRAHGELNKVWEQYNSNVRATAIERNETRKVAAMAGILALFNPIVGLSVAFIALLSGEIRRAELQQKCGVLTTKLNVCSRNLYELETKKRNLKIEKESRLREYLLAKNDYNEYKKNRDIIRTNWKILQIRTYIESKQANALLEEINTSFDAFYAHYHLVPGRIEEKENGVVRWWLYEDGYTDNLKIFQPHSPSPQKHGESYVDFTYNEKGHLVATVEADPVQAHHEGVCGQVNCSKGEGVLQKRSYCGYKQAQQAQTHSEKVLWQSGRSGIDCRIIQNREGKYELQEGQPGGKIVNGRYSEMIWRTTKRFIRFNKIAQKGDNDYFSIVKQDNSRAIIDNHGNEISQRELQRLGISGHGYKGPHL